MNDERSRILKLLEDGRINAKQAARLIEALGTRRHGFDLGPPVPPVASHVRRRHALKELDRIPDLVARAVGKAVQSSFEPGEGRTVRFTGKKSVFVRNVSGDVEVAGTATDTVSIEYTGGVANVKENDDSVDFRSVSSDVSARVPERCDVEVTTVSGDVELQRVGGRARVKTVSGEVGIAGHHGVTEIVTVSGDADLDGVAGEVKVESRSGDIAVVADGQIEGLLATKTGDIEVSLRPDADIVLEAEADEDGRVELQLDVPHEILKQRGNNVSVKFGAGSHSLVVRTRDGEITVRNTKED